MQAPVILSTFLVGLVLASSGVDTGAAKHVSKRSCYDAQSAITFGAISAGCTAADTLCDGEGCNCSWGCGTGKDVSGHPMINKKTFGYICCD